MPKSPKFEGGGLGDGQGGKRFESFIDRDVGEIVGDMQIGSLDAYANELFTEWSVEIGEQIEPAYLFSVSLRDMHLANIAKHPELFARRGSITIDPVSVEADPSLMKPGVLNEFGHGSQFCDTVSLLLSRSDMQEVGFLGIEYAKWLTENPNDIPASLRDGQDVHFLGSLVRLTEGGGFLFTKGACVKGRWKHMPGLALVDKPPTQFQVLIQRAKD